MLDDVHLDVLAIVVFAESSLKGLERIPLQLEVLIRVRADCDGVLRVIGDDHIDDIDLSVDEISLREVLEKLVILSELRKTHNLSVV